MSALPDTGCASDVYKHEPLDLNMYQIRLLRRCNPSENTMDYQLTTFDFDERPPYVALSYTWGEERPTAFVNIEGKKFEIRINLFNFLKTYATDEHLWIDQICIDQSNPDEQSHQVRMMYKVYSECSFVLVWLRDETTCTPSTKQAALDFNNDNQSYSNYGYSFNGSDDDKGDFEWPILALLHNSYFTRLWIVQELLLAKNIHILVQGDVWVSWKSVQMENQKLCNLVDEYFPSTYALVEEQRCRTAIIDHVHAMPSPYITAAVGRYSDKKCKDPRDKIYGLMALIQPLFQVEIDYTKSIHQVFLDAVMVMIREHWYINVISSKDLYRGVPWSVRKSRKSSWSLAQAMGFTYLEMSGLRSFLTCIWKRTSLHVAVARMNGLDMNLETPYITLLGTDPATHQLSGNQRLAATCNRWWYESDGIKYYHDCKKWWGQAKL
jgi:hypothetical protein